MAKICLKWRIYLGIGLSVWETAKIFGKWRRSVGNGQNNWEIWRNEMINGLKMWKVTYLGNDLIICQTSRKCGKWA